MKHMMMGVSALALVAGFAHAQDAERTGKAVMDTEVVPVSERLAADHAPAAVGEMTHAHGDHRVREQPVLAQIAGPAAVAAGTGRASMTTKAWARGYSSVMVTWITASSPNLKRKVGAGRLPLTVIFSMLSPVIFTGWRSMTRSASPGRST
mgnify:CR=1 FL=1